MDMHITEDDFPNIGQTLEILATNFVKGVFTFKRKDDDRDEQKEATSGVENRH